MSCPISISITLLLLGMILPNAAGMAALCFDQDLIVQCFFYFFIDHVFFCKVSIEKKVKKQTGFIS
jgi:hypothetical protein